MTVQQGSVNVRITKQTHQQLATLARENGLSMQTILDQAVEAYRRQSFLEALNADFAALKAHPKHGPKSRKSANSGNRRWQMDVES